MGVCLVVAKEVFYASCHPRYLLGKGPGHLKSKSPADQPGPLSSPLPSREQLDVPNMEAVSTADLIRTLNSTDTQR